MPTLTRAAFAQRIPHAGNMCLLDAVLEYDATTIVCTTRTHRATDNPLRSAGELHALCGVEYAAQAAAIHGTLTAVNARRPKSGFLAALRGVTLSTARLDDIDAELQVRARQVLADDTNCVYEFDVSADARELLRGRLTVVQQF